MSFAQVSESILAFFTELSEAEQRISLSLYRLLAKVRPVVPQALARAAGVPIEEVRDALARWPGLHRATDGAVIGHWGLTIKPTRHRLQLADRTLYAWCAWDALFLPELLGERMRVQSNCPVSGKKIVLEVGPDGAVAAARRPPVSFIALDGDTRDVVGKFCRFVHFFSAEEAGAQWVSQHPGTLLATLDQALQLARRRNALRYPSRLASC